MDNAPAPGPDSGAPEPDADFDTVWERAAHIPGWLKTGQARLLWDEAMRLPADSTVVEIGSHQGRSTVVLGEAARQREGRVIAVDPFVEGRLFGGRPTRELFERNVAAHDLRDVVELVADYSTTLRPGWTRPFDLLYIDGKHDYWTLSDDLRWSTHLGEGAAVVIHDCFSSIGVTLGILRHVLFSSRIAYERRSDSQALFRIRRPTLSDRLRIVAQMPWWLRNVVIKVLLRLRLRPLARLAGHSSPYDPY
ncbi:class I SAM-dependent methyltransferase [Nocardioides sp.]|uniref:class I SAM-dependent methyltransferase n=1 Tax=Nocardioides sp. TaxID=35761 RepID=UPI002735E4D9|nr:class I SAM-dependent methyltransferase [Nocardioides sp.]MDP3894607.1 class I SAM-dependent methyltransferase [Nocardioides sp.]